MSFIIRKATEEDVLPIQHFISKAGVPLNTATIDWKQFLVAEGIQREVVGTVALQPVTAEDTLIRSLIIDSEKINASFILKLLETAVQYAWKTEANAVYLMAKRAGEMFENLGFREVTSEKLSNDLLKLDELISHIDKGYPVYKQEKNVDN